MLFIKMWEGEDYYMSSLCDYFEIFRPTGYSLVKQIKREGERCLMGSSTAPYFILYKTPLSIELDMKIY